ncbi:MAG: lipocalin family protein [Psychrilyobacter sp.]|uniref:lipocalin family protein n=1 Tax=Psychrilyobacter sp. TaxID=2586924 RepID=UPI003C78326F
MHKLIIVILMLTLLSACSNKKEIDLKDHSLEIFSLENYLGKWVEVARTDNKFEKGLTEVTANYFKEDNKIKVVNRGWSEEKQKWSESRGYIKETPKPGRLKVSFFRPFYGSYNVLHVDKDYKYALVGGGASKYLWILKRKDVEISEELLKKYLDTAKNLGYDTEGMIFMKK